MIRAAITPYAERQVMCTLWLEEYFDTYGDQAPNKNETHLLIMQKKCLYQSYNHQFQNSSPPRAVVTESKFIELWNVLFPTCINRSWCDIPGKCDTCYEIDRMRRSSEEKVVQEKLREAHHLHRGGMFMLERNE
jgi:hypothetical protein